jgi:uncharacterized protein (TIGR02594 family)
MAEVPRQFQYLFEEPIPPLMVRVALDMYGTVEVAGSGNSTKIVAWADEVAKVCGRTYDNWAADFYNKDSIPWCGLFIGVVCARASQGRPGRFPPNKYLAALAWADWGMSVAPDDIQVGDVVVLTRHGGGHVTIAAGVSEDGKQFAGVGGNQADAVNIRLFDTERIYAVRRPPYNNKPAGARRVLISAAGEVSTNES